MALFNTIAVDAFVDTDELENKTPWITSTNSPVVARTVIGTILNEQWLRVGSSDPVLTVPFGTPAVGQANEMEIHALVNFDTLLTFANDIISIGNGVNFGTSSTDRVTIKASPNPLGSGEPSILQTELRSSGGGAGGGFLTFDHPEYLAEAGSVFHLVLRAKGETNGGTDDGEFEVFINGALVHQQADIGWDVSVAGARFDTGYAGILFSGTTRYVRDVLVFDAWTTAPGVMPAVGHLTANDPTSTAGAYTNEGGATTPVDALTDSDDNTFLRSSAASDELTLGFTVDPAIASKNVQAVVLQARVSRDGGSFNTIDVDLENAAGTVSLGSSQVPVSVVSPAKGVISQLLTPSSAITADDFSVVIRNGS